MNINADMNLAQSDEAPTSRFALAKVSITISDVPPQSHFPGPNSVSTEVRTGGVLQNPPEVSFVT